MATYSDFHATEPKFYIPVVAAAGALAGLLVGNAQGEPLIGLIIGALSLTAIAFVLGRTPNERAARWGLTIAFGGVGFIIGGLAGSVVGLLFGWFFGWFTYWLALGRYRHGLAPYLTPGQVLWFYTFRVICGAIFTFLITPILSGGSISSTRTRFGSLIAGPAPSESAASRAT